MVYSYKRTFGQELRLQKECKPWFFVHFASECVPTGFHRKSKQTHVLQILT